MFIVFFTFSACSSKHKDNNSQNETPLSSYDDNTLLGVDSNNNQIRDDIDIYIENKYGANYQLKRALLESAKASNEFLRATTKEDVLEAVRKGNIANDAVFKSAPSPHEAAKISRDLEVKMINSKKRLKKYLENNAQLSGSFFEIE